MATWRSGDAADCKSVHAGSIPAVASTYKTLSRDFHYLLPVLSNRIEKLDKFCSPSVLSCMESAWRWFRISSKTKNTEQNDFHQTASSVGGLAEAGSTSQALSGPIAASIPSIIEAASG